MKIMKKLTAYCLLLTASLLLAVGSLPLAVYAAGASLSLSPSTGTFNKGCSFSLEVKVDTGGAQTDGTDAILIYDPTRFTATAIRSGVIYSDYPGNSIDTQAGKITISGLASVSAPFTGQGTLAILEFTVPSIAPEGATQIIFDFDNADKTKTIDSNVVERGTVVDILSQVTNGSFTIGTGVCGAGAVTPTPRVIPQGGEDKTPVITSPPQKPLPEAADLKTTFMLGAGGMLLVILGILGLALL